MNPSDNEPRPRLTLLVVAGRGRGALPSGLQHAVERDTSDASATNRVAALGGSLIELETSERLFWSLAFAEERLEALAKSVALIATAKPDAVVLIGEENFRVGKATLTRLEAARRSGATQAIAFLCGEGNTQAMDACEEDARGALKASGFDEGRARVVRGSDDKLWRFSSGRPLRDLGDDDADDDDEAEDEYGRPYGDPDDLRGEERRRTAAVLRSFVAALNALEPAGEDGGSRLDSIGSRFSFAACGLPVTRPVIEMAPGELRELQSYERNDWVPIGRFVRGDGSRRHVEEGQILLHGGDLMNNVVLREASRGGCCGLYPKEGMLNITCAAGHPIAERWTECVFPSYVGAHLDRIRLE
jgi:hypothetical protein